MRSESSSSSTKVLKTRRPASRRAPRTPRRAASHSKRGPGNTSARRHPRRAASAATTALRAFSSAHPEGTGPRNARPATEIASQTLRPSHPVDATTPPALRTSSDERVTLDCQSGPHVPAYTRVHYESMRGERAEVTKSRILTLVVQQAERPTRRRATGSRV